LCGAAAVGERGVALIAFDARDAFVPMPHGSGIYVRRLLEAMLRLPPDGNELWPLQHGSRGPELIWEQFALPRLLRRRKAALVHGPDSFLPLRRSCPGVVTIHDLAFEAIPADMPPRTTFKYRVFARRAATSAERVICPSRFTADDLEQRYRIAPERIRVIPEAPALAAGTLAPPAGPYVLAAGDLRRKKNLPVLINAFRLLTDEGFPHRLILAGADLGLGGELLERGDGLALELAGFVDDEQLDALIRGADALVLPGIYEGFGLVALDAMARGCPTLLARAGALPETGGDAALYFDPYDAEDLASALRGVLGAADERIRLATAGRDHATTFSWDQTAAATVAVYEELL
jgi:glycosyltransferase involved in cell wall biosynthesis